MDALCFFSDLHPNQHECLPQQDLMKGIRKYPPSDLDQKFIHILRKKPEGKQSQTVTQTHLLGTVGSESSC